MKHLIAISLILLFVVSGMTLDQMFNNKSLSKNIELSMTKGQ